MDIPRKKLSYLFRNLKSPKKNFLKVLRDHLQIVTWNGL